MRVRLIHGFNVSDGGASTIDKMAPVFIMNEVPVVQDDYGWVFLFGLRFRNKKTVDRLISEIEPGDVLVAHSNGCLIAWKLVEAGAPVSAVVCIQPSLRKDTRWRSDVPVLCLYNKEDYVVSLGRLWGRFASVANPWRDRHGWGAAGRYGFVEKQKNVENWNTGKGPHPATGHFGLRDIDAWLHWAPRVFNWCANQTDFDRRERVVW